ncbi:hypothetical protein, partial [Roseibacillus persicicus]
PTALASLEFDCRSGGGRSNESALSRSDWVCLNVRLKVDMHPVIVDAKAAAEWISGALNYSDYNADFSLKSLYEVDRFFEEQTKDGEPVEGGLLSEDRGQRLFALGSYVGEVLIRKTNGVWFVDANDPAAEINIQIRTESGVEAWPVQRVIKRYRNGPEDSIGDYGQALLRYANQGKNEPPRTIVQPPPLPPQTD